MKTEENTSVIDTSKMSAAQRAALEMTEAARERRGQARILRRLVPRPFRSRRAPSLSRAERGGPRPGRRLPARLENLLREQVDPDEIDRTGEIPDAVLAELAAMGAFGIKIATKYGGLGLSQTNYCRAGMLLGSYCGNLTALISAHQSIGVPQPLILFGTEEQKQKISAPLGQGRNFRVRADRAERRLRSGQDRDPRGADRRRLRLHPQRRKALVHQRREGGRHRGHGADGAQERQGPDHGLHRGNGYAGRRSRAPLPVHGTARRSTMASSVSPTCGCRARTSFWPRARACAWR